MPAIKKPIWVKQEEEIVRILKIGLLDKGWTVAHLAKLMKMNAPNLSKMINHTMSVKFETILTIAGKLGIDSLPIIK